MPAAGISTGKGSLEMWIRPAVNQTSDITEPRLFGFMDSAGTAGVDFLFVHFGQIWISFAKNAVYTEAHCNNPVWTANQVVHLVFNWDMTTLAYSIYQNGTQICASTFPQSVTTLATGNAYISLSPIQGGRYFNGTIDEVATYAAPLSGAQVTAHYQQGIGTYGGNCVSNSIFSSNVWNYIGGIYDGTYATLVVNGRQECKVVAPSSLFTTPATNPFAGATAAATKIWQGILGSLRIYGSSNGTSVGATTEVPLLVP